MGTTISPITLADVASFRACLDAVAKEQSFLALLEAPPLKKVKAFVAENLAKQVPQVVAKDGEVVVGWCDISPGWHHTLQHCGALGMGLLREYRGRGIGGELLQACLALAKDRGITRVELEARADNEAALRLYRRFGFEYEGTKKRGMRVNGEYQDTIAMALLL
jgi:putative acetyltransferase